MTWDSTWCRATCSASRWRCGNSPARALNSLQAPTNRPDAGSLELHFDAFRNVGAEAGRDDNAAAYLEIVVVAGPYRVATGTEERIGVRRLSFGGIERIARIIIEDARLLGAATVGLHVDDFLVVARQRQRDLAAEIFRRLGVEHIRIGFAGRGVELARAQSAAAGNALVVRELKIVGCRCLSQRHERQRSSKTDLHDVVHPDHPQPVFRNA